MSSSQEKTTLLPKVISKKYEVAPNLKKSWHWVNIFLTLCNCGFLVGMVICIPNPQPHHANDDLFQQDDDGILNQCGGVGSSAATACTICFSLFYLFYLLECYRSSTRKFVGNLKTTESVVDYVNRLRSYPCYLGFNVRCWHNETRSRVVTNRDANGNTYTTVETYTVQVTTFTDSIPFNYTTCVDSSSALPSWLYSHEAVKIENSKMYILGDNFTSKRFNEIKLAAYEDNKFRDVHCIVEVNMRIRDFESHILSVVDRQKKSMILNSGCFWLLSFVLLSWPYRVWLEYYAVKLKYTFKKTVTLKPDQVDQVGHVGQV